MLSLRKLDGETMYRIKNTLLENIYLHGENNWIALPVNGIITLSNASVFAIVGIALFAWLRMDTRWIIHGEPLW